MNPEIVNNHLATSKSAVKFLEYSVTQGRCLKRLDLLDDSLPGFFRNYPYPLHSWPWFVGGRMRQTLENCACRIPALIYKAIHREFAGDPLRLAAFYGMPEVLARIFLDSAPNLAQVMLRMDAILTATGLKIMEVNAGPSIGGWQIQWMDQQYRKQPALMPFFAEHECRSKNIPLGYMRHLVRQALAVASADAKANVLFIIEEPILARGHQQSFENLFREALAERGVDGGIWFESGFANVTFERNGVYLRGQRLGALVSYVPELEPPVDLYRASLRELVYWPGNPFIGVIGDKRSLAILYKHRNAPVFDEAERRLIDEHVPWSAPIVKHDVEYRGAACDLEQLLLAEREHMVVKVARGQRGDDVYVGRFQTPEQWRAVVARAFAEGAWLAQEYCASLPFYGQSGTEGYAEHDVIWGVFGFGLEYGGCWLRLMLKDMGNGIINSDKGAQETIVYEVHE